MPPKRRRRFQGLYYHSSPPKVLPMNDQASNQNGRRRRDVDDFSIKLSTIRIWMHEKDIGKLTRILWAGQGNRLRQQASTNPRVKRFLAAVPYVMNNVKEVHQAVIDNNLETLQAKLEPPVPPALMTGKDANGLNIIHKAAGLGHTKMLEYLISIWPEGANETDITGKTALHWAASAKNNMRCYTLLTQAGCDEEAVDYKSRTPSYYRHKPQEIERAFLVYVPEAPRVSPDVATDWDALSEDNNNDSKKSDIKAPLANGINGRSNEDSIENTSEVDLNDGLSANDEDENNNHGELKESEENGVESAPDTAEIEESGEVNGNGDKIEAENKKEESHEEENNAISINETAAIGSENGDDETIETRETEINVKENGEQENGEGEQEEEVEKEEEEGNRANEVKLNANEESNEEEQINGSQRVTNGTEEPMHTKEQEILSEKLASNEPKEEEKVENIVEDEEIDQGNKIEAKHDNDDESKNTAGTEVDAAVKSDDENNIELQENRENEEQHINHGNDGDDNDDESADDGDSNKSEKTDEENVDAYRNVEFYDDNDDDGDIPIHVKNEYENIRANKILKQEQEAGEITFEVKSTEAKNKFDDDVQKQNSDNDKSDEDDDEVQFGKL